jgi:ubiquinone/menaquinone biosynthesis C-methylase UbiE
MQSEAKPTSRRAFRSDAAAALAGASAKAAFWTAAGSAVRRIARTEGAPPALKSDAPPPPKGYLRKAWIEAFEKDARDVAAGLYPLAEKLPADPMALYRRARDLFADAHEVRRRRVEGAATEARDEAGSEAYPTYYRQNFHYQSGGWFTPESARRYEAQVEALFAGAAGPMRRRALSLLAKAWRTRDQRGLTLVDIACGSGAFLADLKAAFPRAAVMGLDLSPAYLAEALERSGAVGVQGLAEKLPFADASLDGLTCVYLFHELPPRIRPLVAAELARVLKPGGVLALADAVQADRAPELARPLAAFPAFFHEPYFDSYQATDLVALFAGVGLTLKARDEAFLTQALLFEKL